MTDELPEGWVGARLRDGLVRDAQPGFACGKHSRDSQGVAHLRPMNVSEAGRIRLDDVKFIDNAEVDRDQRWIRSGDVLFNNTNSPELVGKTAVYTEREPRAFSNHMTRLRCTDAADPQFLAHAIHQRWREGLFASICNNHVSQASISTEVLLDLELPVPPLAEQRRIVAKVEALLEQVRRAKDRLDRVPLILKRFRQAVLAAACSGQLTEGWRAFKRRVGIASDRLPTLETKRRALWERRASDRGGSKRKYPEPFDPAPPDDVEIPEGWAWASVSALAFLDVGFAFPSKGFKESGVRLLRGENIAPGTLRWSDTKCWPASDVAPHQHLLVEPGEIILGMDRPLVAAGLKIARAKSTDLPALLVQRVMRFKMADPKDTDFLFLCLSERRFIEFLAHDGMTGSDLPHITGTGVAEFPVPLPPADEQAEIVRRVDDLSPSPLRSSSASSAPQLAPAACHRRSCPRRSPASLCRPKPSWRAPGVGVTRRPRNYWVECVARPGRLRLVPPRPRGAQGRHSEGPTRSRCSLATQPPRLIPTSRSDEDTMKAINQDQNQVTKAWLNRQLRMIERHRGEDALAILGPIQSGLEHVVRNALESIPKRSDRLLVILDTPGGHVEVVVRLVTIMRKLFQSVSFLVPDRAMSAGTVLVMSGDAIMMDYFSCLGPIDPQVKKGDTWVPALSYLRQFEALIEKSRNGTLTVAELALLKQLNLAELHQIELQGQLSVDLIKRWLVQYKFKDWKETAKNKTAVTQKLKEDRADQIAKILNQHDRWHSHGRGIGMDVLTSEEIRLKIDDYSADKKFHGLVWDYFTCLSDFAARNKLPGFVHTRSFF